ncbi:GspE/PulE family protein [Peptostreptococcus russellii]|uniref:GspE/PulE family protein n=1 Tax=Peptostreptococcus russellii TaxID=215200 RepID=UPI003F5900F3
MDKLLSNIINAEYAYSNTIFPVSINDKELTVQMKAFDINLINNLRIISNREIIVIQKSEEEILKNIGEYYKRSDRNDKNYAELMFENLIEIAVKRGASDIHIEPFDSYARVRYRIEGDLINVSRYTIEDYIELSTIIKLKASCDITEKRIAQDGRFSYYREGFDVDIRLGCIATVYGEKLALRILDRNNFIQDRKSLGFSREAIEIMDEIIIMKSGILLITGPTGSGKSSTVYSILNEIKNQDINIMTIEDPVEYKIEGVNQIQVNLKSGIRFDNGLRAILRQDPDVIILGEIRDYETAKIAIRAAITGHLVISTLHTNDALSSIARLRDMGIEPYLIKASLLGVVSQRLVKSKGKNEKLVSSENLSRRKLIYELLKINKEIQEAIVSDKDIEYIKEVALKSGMISFEDSIERI